MSRFSLKYFFVGDLAGMAITYGVYVVHVLVGAYRFGKRHVTDVPINQYVSKYNTSSYWLHSEKSSRE